MDCLSAVQVDEQSATISHIDVNGIAYSVFESEELVIFKQDDVMNTIGYAQPCFMNSTINIFKISVEAVVSLCGEIEIEIEIEEDNDNDDELEGGECFYRRCIEMITGV